MYETNITQTDISSSQSQLTYAGIGSRETPAPILARMTQFASDVNHKLILRSGGAPGADTAFELGTSADRREIYLPWKGFNGNPSLLYPPASSWKCAFDLAATIHPAWDRLKNTIRPLIARNMYQVLGPNLTDPVSFVVCYTSDGAEKESECTKNTGGTGTAIILASRLEIPVFNLKWGDDRYYDLLDLVATL